MYIYCIIENNMYLCNVIKNKDYKKPPGLPKARQTLFQGIKSGYYRNTRPGKRKIKLSSFVAKQRYVFLSVPENYPERKYVL